MKIYISIVLLLFLIGCNQKENRSNTQAEAEDSISIKKEIVEAKPSNKQLGDTIQMQVIDENGYYSAMGTIDSVNSRIYVKFNTKVAGNLKASILPQNGDGNIRFNQIILPDKSSDGPFGKEFDYQLKSSGDYTLVIGHSLMADGQYFGKFEVRLKVL